MTKKKAAPQKQSGKKPTQVSPDDSGSMKVFLDRMQGSAADRDDVFAKTRNYIRREVDEKSFTGKILKLEGADKFKPQQSVNNEGLCVITNVDPDRAAIICCGKDSKYFNGLRAEIPFITIATPVYEKYVEELYAYQIPPTKMFEDTVITDMADCIDGYFIKLAKMSAFSSKNVFYSDERFGKRAMANGCSLVDGADRHAAQILISKIAYNTFASGDKEEFGSSLAGDVAVNHYRYDKVLGHKLTVTVKARFFTANPYAVSDESAIAFDQAHKPYDPAFPIGVDLAGCFIGGEPHNGKYPHGKILLNGSFINSFSSGKAGSEASAVEKTTASWLGNLSFYFTRAEYLGKYYKLRDIDFAMGQWARMMRWEAWANRAIAITDTKAVGMVVSL